MVCEAVTRHLSERPIRRMDLLEAEFETGHTHVEILASDRDAPVAGWRMIREWRSRSNGGTEGITGGVDVEIAVFDEQGKAFVNLAP